MRTARLRLWTSFALLCVVPALSGCAALVPLDGIPANYYPRELRGETRSGKRTIDLSLLGQTPCEEYRLDSGDVLAVFIHGVLGTREQLPPVYFPRDTDDTPPSFGYPVAVRSDGTVRLPLGEPVMVRGLTEPQAEDAIREMLFKNKLLNADGAAPTVPTILISLQRKRKHTIMVIRQEQTATPTAGGPGQLQIGNMKRGTGKVVKLDAGKNDVLNAITETGGLPGLDAENTIYVIRRRAVRQGCPPPPGRGMPIPGQLTRNDAVEELPPSPSYHEVGSVVPAHDAAGHSDGRVVQVNGDSGDPIGHSPAAAPDNYGGVPGPAINGYTIPHGDAQGGISRYGAPYAPWPAFQNGEIADPDSFLAQRQLDSEILTIPVRLAAGEVPMFAEADIILRDGDIVFIESRETEVFYTGGLLPGNQFALPRDYDIDVVRAIAIASGQNQQGSGSGFGSRMGGVSALNRDISVSASEVIVLRQFPDGNQVPIRVDLNKALRNPRYSIRILPGDYVILQYKPHEAVCAFIERNLLAGGLIGIAATNVTGGSN